MRKAQSMEFIGIMLLLIVITVFALFGRLSAGDLFVKNTKNTLSDYQTHRFLITAKVFPYVTVHAVPVEQLLSVYLCYANSTINYGTDDIMLPDELRTILDTTLDKDTWLLQLGDKACVTSTAMTNGTCTLPARSMQSQEFAIALPCKPAMDRAILFMIDQ